MCNFVNQSIKIYIAPLQDTYSEALVCMYVCLKKCLTEGKGFLKSGSLVSYNRVCLTSLVEYSYIKSSSQNNIY